MTIRRQKSAKLLNSFATNKNWHYILVDKPQNWQHRVNTSKITRNIADFKALCHSRLQRFLKKMSYITKAMPTLTFT